MKIIRKIRNHVYKKLSRKKSLNRGLELKTYYEIEAALEDLQAVHRTIKDEVKNFHMASEMSEDEREIYCLDGAVDPEYLQSCLNSAGLRIERICHYLEAVLGIHEI